MDKTYTRQITLTEVIIDKENNLVTGLNDSGARVVMTIKQFNELYKEG